MSDDLIAEIRARHSDRTEIKESGGYMLNGFSALGSLAQSQEDLATALAEIERLTRERDDALSREKDYRDEVELDQFCASSKSKGGWLVIQSLLAEVERLRSENERLREELALMKAGFEVAWTSMGSKP